MRRLIRMASDNARHFLENPEEAGPAGEDLLGELRDVLRLTDLPRRIEAFDISNLQGTDAVACMVVFLDGKPIGGKLTITDSPRDGMLCTLDGKVVKLVTVVQDEDTGEIEEIHLEKVEE